MGVGGFEGLVWLLVLVWKRGGGGGGGWGGGGGGEGVGGGGGGGGGGEFAGWVVYVLGA